MAWQCVITCRNIVSNLVYHAPGRVGSLWKHHTRAQFESLWMCIMVIKFGITVTTLAHCPNAFPRSHPKGSAQKEEKLSQNRAPHHHIRSYPTPDDTGYKETQPNALTEAFRAQSRVTNGDRTHTLKLASGRRIGKGSLIDKREQSKFIDQF